MDCYAGEVRARVKRSSDYFFGSSKLGGGGKEKDHSRYNRYNSTVTTIATVTIKEISEKFLINFPESRENMREINERNIPSFQTKCT